MTTPPYALTFTTGAAFLSETVLLAELYNKEKDWDQVRTDVLATNLLQARTQSTLKKLYRELSSRLKKLSGEEISLFVNATEPSQKQLVWLAICRRHKLIADFAVEVLSHNYSKSQYLLSKDDYDIFYHRKAEWHSNLDEASSATKSKARQVLFKMLRECGLINEQSEIVAQRLNPQLHDLLQETQPTELRVFPGGDY